MDVLTYSGTSYFQPAASVVIMLTAWTNGNSNSYMYDGTLSGFLQNSNAAATSLSQTNNHKVFINNGHYLQLNTAGEDKMYCGVQVA